MKSLARRTADLIGHLEPDGLPADQVPIDAIDGLDADNTQEALEALAEGAGGGEGEVNTASNLGSGAGVYASKSGADLRFRSLSAGQGVQLVEGANAIEIRRVYIQDTDPGAVGAGVLWVRPMDGSPDPDPEPEPEEPIVILATGQSNMFIDRSMSWSPNSRVKLWNNSRASDTSAGSTFSSLSSSQMNVAASYAHQVALANPNREVRLINISAGSLGIASWIGGAKYDITAQTVAPPASANVRFNNSTQASATQMFIHKTDKQGSGRHSHYIRVASGTRIYVRNASGVLRTYAATGNPTDNGTYITIPIAYQSGSTANFSGTLDILVQPDFQQAMSAVVPAALASAGKSTVDVFLWWQGESDAAYNSEAGYKADWNKMKTWLNGQSWFPSNTKTLIFSPVSTAISINGAAYWDQMRTWLQDIRNADSASRYWINLPVSLNSSYWTDSNNVHMTAEGYRQAGILAAGAYTPS